MSTLTATAVANANIALIKYWGNRDHILRLPSTGSISMNLERLVARTQVVFLPELPEDSLTLNGKPQNGNGLTRLSNFLDLVRLLAGKYLFARVTSENNFPTGAGLASSAAAYAALTLAATSALGLKMNERDLSRLARRGSGSACRSIPGGFVEWKEGSDGESSYAFTIAPPDHWGLVDCIAIVDNQPKTTGSTEGHLLSDTSPLQKARVDDSTRRLDICRQAILKRDFDSLAAICELDSNLMHSVMMTSSPALFYWQPATLQLMKAITDWRHQGLPAFYTLDAGPNVHILCEQKEFQQVFARLEHFPGVLEVIASKPGGPARIEETL